LVSLPIIIAREGPHLWLTSNGGKAARKATHTNQHLRIRDWTLLMVIESPLPPGDPEVPYQRGCVRVSVPRPALFRSGCVDS
jgi:hypothetical protein